MLETGGAPLISGLHHITSIAGHAQRAVDFYAGVLGLRLVKQTVNGADPEQLHLFFGDWEGSPGSIMTVFVWPNGNPAQHGVGEVAITSFAVGPHALGFWIERLVQRGIAFDGPTKRVLAAGPVEHVLSLRDPDGLMLEIVASGSAPDPVNGNPLGEHAIRGLHSVALWVEHLEDVVPLLTETLGFRPARSDGAVHRFVLGDGGSGQIVDVRAVGGFVKARAGTGGVDHVAWAVEGSLEPLTVFLDADRVAMSGIVDRRYFASIYARDGSGILHEFATVGPGFTIDENLDALGTSLMLPAEWEDDRAAISARLPAFVVPGTPPSAAWFAHLDQPGDTSDERDHYQPYDYVWEDGSDPSKILVALHGTGGNERSLLPLAASIGPDVPVIGPRGKVREGSARRFFRRVAEGQLDQEDLRFRTREMNAFLRGVVEERGLEGRLLVAFGFSNGANLAASMLLRGDTPIGAAILLSPMLPFVPESLPDLRDVAVFVGAGESDPLVPFDQAEELAAILERSGASVTLFAFDGGHTVTAAELDAARDWFRDR